MDLHLHTSASSDYKQPNVTYLDFLKQAEEKNLDIIAFTDHNTIAGYAAMLKEIEDLETLERLKRLRDDERKRLDEYRRLREKILILPGFEFTATLGFHILGIFPPETTVRELEHLLLSLRVPAEKLDQGSGEVGATSDALTAYRTINEAGGLAIAAHANSSHGVAMPGFDFGGQTRIAYTQDANLHALEVTDLESKSRRRTAAFFSGTKPEYPRRMHCIQGSDAHKLEFDPRFKNEMGVGDRATEILLDEVSFDAIKAVLLSSDFSRTRPSRSEAEEPFDPLREAREQGDTLVQAFHAHLTEKRGIARKVLEDVVALANTNGGTIYVGVSANVKQAVAGVDRPDRAISELRAAISKEITPLLEVQVEVLKSHGKNVLQVIVPRGSQVPYALGSSAIYIRSEDETGLATRDEIVQLVRDALAVEFAATMPAPVEVPVSAEQQTQVAAPAIALSVDPPRTGVEIVTSEVRKGTRYFSVRDLRNGRIVQNVTLKSARSLWQYAIEQAEKNPCDPKAIGWVGDIGIWKTYKRSGKIRYDLVQRAGSQLFVYYGVTDDGIHGPWRKLVGGDGGAEEEPDVESEMLEETPSPTEIAAEHEEAMPTTYAEEPAEEPEPAFLNLEPLPDADEMMREELSEPDEEIASVPATRAEESAPSSLATREESAMVPKSRAQAWREQLDRALEQARAAQDAEHARADESETQDEIDQDDSQADEDEASRI
jgi:hypothetical protein